MNGASAQMLQGILLQRTALLQGYNSGTSVLIRHAQIPVLVH